MSNPFATPAANTPAADPFASKTKAASGPTGGDPFATAPDAPVIDAITKDDAKAGAVCVMRVRKLENVKGKFPNDKTGEYDNVDRLTVDVTLCNSVNGKAAGTKYEDMWIFWNRVVRQFGECAGDGNVYLVKFGVSDRAVTAEEVTDPAARQAAAQYV